MCPGPPWGTSVKAPHGHPRLCRAAFGMALMKRIRPKQLPKLPDGRSMTDDDFRELHDRIAAFDDVECIAGDTREIVERFMPDLAYKLPDRTTETFDQAVGRIRGGAVRNVTKGRKQPKPRR